MSKNLKIILYLLFIVLIVTGVTEVSYATSDGDLQEIGGLKEDEKPELEKNTNTGFLLLRYILSITGVILLTFFGVKYIASKLNAPSFGKEWITILDQITLGSGKGIYLVDIEDKGYVLGVTDQQINVITVIEDDDRLNELRKVALNSMYKNKYLKNKNINFHTYLQRQIKNIQKLANKKEGEKKYE